MQIGINHFGHFLLGVLLAPALELGARARGRPSRLVSLSSIGHRRSGIHWDDPNYLARPYDQWEAYGQAKTANALFAVGFERRTARRGIHANAVMPGGIMTPLQRHLAREEMVAMGWIDAATGQLRDGFKKPEQGASTSVWAALGASSKAAAACTSRIASRPCPGRRKRPGRGCAACSGPRGRRAAVGLVGADRRRRLIGNGAAASALDGGFAMGLSDVLGHRVSGANPASLEAYEQAARELLCLVGDPVASVGRQSQPAPT